MQKLKNVRKFLKKNEVYFTSKLEDTAWLTGFAGSFAYVVISSDFALLATDVRYETYAKELLKKASGIELVIVKKDELFFEELGKHERLLAAPSVPAYILKALKNETKVKIDKVDIFQEIRKIKTDLEIALIREQYHLAAQAFLRTLESINFGETELSWAAMLEYNMRKLGARSPSFETIVASGLRGSLPHGTATEKIIEKNDAITIDFGSKNIYTSDYTRVVYNRKNKNILDVIKVVREALNVAKEKVKPGVPIKELDIAARKIIKKAGFGDYFAHGLGHGVGVEVHERPYLKAVSEEFLESGMVFTIEPGIYIPGKFGIRLEDTVLVTGNGFELLSSELGEYVYTI